MIVDRYVVIVHTDSCLADGKFLRRVVCDGCDAQDAMGGAVNIDPAMVAQLDGSCRGGKPKECILLFNAIFEDLPGSPRSMVVSFQVNTALEEGMKILLNATPNSPVEIIPISDTVLTSFFKLFSSLLTTVRLSRWFA